ncbi:hypothetical protein PRZ48_009496 [Zasmidium cellare]|uniref:Uncharacterized protein n=1 Tax=Zasmidium cellare TaxID=395010 RepID=A0ABR0ECI7_ZASCE|nr:hypothetical protein PRZ48_009496 [Zasmidium cellare]
MKTTTSAWAAALAVMSMHGPFTTAEAAPARPQQEPERPKLIVNIRQRFIFVTIELRFGRRLHRSLATSEQYGNLIDTSHVVHFPDEQLVDCLRDQFQLGPDNVDKSLFEYLIERSFAFWTAIGGSPTDGIFYVQFYERRGIRIKKFANIEFELYIGRATNTWPTEEHHGTLRFEHQQSISFAKSFLPERRGGEQFRVEQPSAEVVSPTRSSESQSSSSRPAFNPPRPLAGSDAPSGSGIPETVVPPTARSSTAENGTASTTAPPSSTTAPIIVGLSTIIESSTIRNTTPSRTTEGTRPTVDVSSESYTQGTGTGSISSSTDGGLLGGILPTQNSTSTEPSQTSSSEGLLGGILPTGSGSRTGTGEGADTTTAYSGTGTAPITSKPTASTSENLSSVVSSVASEISSVASSVISEASANTTAPSTSTDASAALSNIASSLSSELSSIVATATDSKVSSSLASEFSGILSSAASSLASQISTAPPSASATTTGTAESIIGTGTSTGSFTLSTSTGSSGVTVIPIPVATPSSSKSQDSQSGSTSFEASLTASVTATNETSSLPTASTGTAYSTSIPLTTGATLTLGSSSSSSETSTISSSNSSVTATGTHASVTSFSATSSTHLSTIESSTSTNESSTAAIIATQPSSTSVEASTTSTSVPTAAETTTSKAPTSIVPTGSDSATILVVPTSLVYAPTTTPSPTVTESGSNMPVDSSTSSASTGLPTYMPRLIQPPGGMPQAPANTTLIQVGFNYGLNFPFVVSTENSASQIFAYLPQGIAYTLGLDSQHVKMNALMPFDTTKTMNYITTLAQAYIPANMVDQLQLDLHTPLSAAYKNPDESVRMLMSMINPAIPVLPGANMDDGTETSASYNPQATSSGKHGDGAPIGGDSGSSQSVKSSSVGIGLGACAGAALYAAAMVYVARRYRKKRQSHKRAPSLQTPGEMSQRSPATLSGGGMGGYFMSGANGIRGSGTTRGTGAGARGSGSGSGSGGRGSRNSAGSSNGRSVREQGISAPVMAENSLGWN